ncbi:hypothetical protein [Kribbella sp. NPDC000426]|uniref:hypothetical protein n=1 Tax=Kribbella sp. NPDC000426 TaxID=3154255 RepID=UPI00332DD60F
MGAMRPLVVMASVGALVLGVTACSKDGKASSPAATATPSGVPVEAGTAAEASHGGVKVVLPGSSVGGSGRLRVEDDTSLPRDAAGLHRFGDGVRVELSGAQLKGRATVTFAVPAGWDPNVVPVVAWQDGHGGWRWLPTSQWRPGQPTVTAQTDHFSSGFLGGFDIKAAASEALSWLGNRLSGRAGVAQPRCNGETTLRTRVKVVSDGGDSVKWCAGVESGHAVLRIANNRLAFTQVTYPNQWKVIAGDRFGFSGDALTQWIATGGEKVLTPRGKSVILIPRGESVTLRLPDVPDATVWAEISQVAYVLQIIELAMSVRKAVSKAAGQAVETDGWMERLAKTVTTGDPSKAWTEAAKGCLKSFRDEYTDNFFEVAEVTKSIKESMKFAARCTAEMARAQTTDVAMFLGGLVFGVIDFVVSTIGAALSLLIISAREIVDSVASFGGKSNPIYGISFVPKSVPTEVIKVDPLMKSGGAKSGWKVEDTGKILECAPSGEAYPSPAAVSSGIYSCGYVADGADVCWVTEQQIAMCGGAPWDKRLYRWTVNESVLPSVKPEANPYPWGLELSDGTRCRLRNGGSWSGRPDGWNGAYYCEGVNFVVLADTNHDYRYLDKSTPTWKVWVGDLDDSAKSMPPPKVMAVTKAYFASN